MDSATGSPLPPACGSFSQRSLAGFMEALAPLRSAFDDDSISEIMVNGPHDVFIRQQGSDRRLETALSAGQIRTAIQLLASMADKVVDRVQLVLSARLPGFRVEAALPPVSVKGPSMCIRRHATRILGLDDYVAAGAMSPGQAETLRDTVRDRRNFLIAGGTNSGKTTLMNCVLALIPPAERLFVIEQVQELKIASPNHVLIECDPEQGVTARRAVMVGMRYSPDRIILGELRGQEAFDWLDASNTGHPGSAATIHADGASDALSRLESLVMMANSGIPFEAVQARIAATVHMIFFLRQKDGLRRLCEICRVTGYDRANGRYRTEEETNA